MFLGPNAGLIDEIEVHRVPASLGCRNMTAMRPHEKGPGLR
jgi:hypothetical protein